MTSAPSRRVFTNGESIREGTPDLQRAVRKRQHPQSEHFVDAMALLRQKSAPRLALVLSSPAAFLIGFVLLLIIDLFWAVATHFLTGRLYQVKSWLLINIVTLAVIAIVHWTPLLDEIEPIYLVIVAVARTFADYTFSWEFYFPETEREGS